MNMYSLMTCSETSTMKCCLYTSRNMFCLAGSAATLTRGNLMAAGGS